MSKPEARIVEVLMRDGLQTMVHETGWHVPTTEEKIALIGKIADTGISEIEVTGFVHPKVIPMLADELPAPSGSPRPLSSTVSSIHPAFSSSLTCTAVAPECRAMFVSASCAIR